MPSLSAIAFGTKPSTERARAAALRPNRMKLLGSRTCHCGKTGSQVSDGRLRHSRPQMGPTPGSWVQGVAKPGSHFSTLRASLSRSRCSWSGASSRIFHRAASAPPLRFRTPYEARFRHPATRQEPNSTRRIIPLSAPVRRKHPRAFSEPANPEEPGRDPRAKSLAPGPSRGRFGRSPVAWLQERIVPANDRNGDYP
jgi:hypothetical protein